MDQDKEVIQEFLIESSENLARLDQEFVELEKQPGDRELLSSIFRTIHTIKGTCGFFQFSVLEGIAHWAENLLSQLRDGEKELTPELTTLLLEAVDAIKQILSELETSGTEGEETYGQLRARLEAACEKGTSGSGLPVTQEGEVFKVEDPAAGSDKTPSPAEQTAVTGKDVPQGGSSPEPSLPDTETVSGKEDAGPGGGSAPPRRSIADSTIRVDVDLLDKLMNLAGELVLSRNQILQFAALQQDANILSTSQRLNLITTELQAAVMKTRMQPIGMLWNKLPRLVRDLANSFGKEINLEMEGAETELDKTVLEAIKDPLTHIVRNSCDHGIETAAERTRKDKPARGTLSLRAYHEGGQVNIEISDDGAGIHPQKLREKAIEKGVLTSDQAQRMSEKELIQLVFAAGFSTAAEVTKISGRGVGMDVVKTHIDKIGGTIDLQSRVDHGTTIKIKIPLTLAIIPALIVSSAAERFAIPQVNLLELVRLDGETVKTGIEWIHGAPVYRLRGKLLPLVYLNKILAVDAEQDAAGDDSLNIVVLQADDQTYGLVVDSVHDTQEIVVKPLSKLLKGLNCYAGATIMGDGNVALILDVMGLAQLGQVLAEGREQTAAGKEQQAETSMDRQAVLLLRCGAAGRLAVPLSLVDRLEEFPRSQIEHSGEREVVQYRGQILPLIPLGRHLDLPGGTESPEDDPVQAVVFSEGQRRIGLVVDEILDIVDEAITVRSQDRRPGILGSAVVAGHVTDFIDLHHLIQAVDEDWFSSPKEEGAAEAQVLLAEPSAFARSLVRSYLEMAGHVVFEAGNSEEVLSRLGSHRVDVLLSGLDWPGEDPLELLRRIRLSPEWKEVPVVALAGHPEETEKSAERDLDFNEYHMKFDREAVLGSIARLASATERRQAVTQRS